MKNRKFYDLRIFDEVDIIDRSGAEALISEQRADEIIQGVTQQSVVLRLGHRLANMTSSQTRLPVLSSLPIAYFVGGDTGRKKTTNQEWKNKFVKAAEIAAIVPIPIAVLDDADYDIWGEVQPRLIEAFGKIIDEAVLLGEGKPDVWPDGIVTQAINVGASVNSGVNLYDDLLGIGGTISKVEESGYNPNGHVADIGMKANLRSLKDNNGHPLFLESMQSAGNYTLDGSPITFATNGSIDKKVARMITGDFNQLVYAIRTDISFKVFDQGVIQDANGEIKYNLLQQDMVALRATMRLGWELPNPVTSVGDPTTRFPFAVLLPAASNSQQVASVEPATVQTQSVVNSDYTAEQLNGMTVDQIKSLADACGYKLSGRTKDEMIAEFITSQNEATSVG